MKRHDCCSHWSDSRGVLVLEIHFFAAFSQTGGLGSIRQNHKRDRFVPRTVLSDVKESAVFTGC